MSAVPQRNDLSQGVYKIQISQFYDFFMTFFVTIFCAAKNFFRANNIENTSKFELSIFPECNVENIYEFKLFFELSIFPERINIKNIYKFELFFGLSFFSERNVESMSKFSIFPECNVENNYKFKLFFEL